ncbi:MAG TPA: sterol carrier protein domain-containing protein, partial [Roseiflexaceae bacterium]|nr:sterol carrier protein domain-containing protein [Roseiflexaceae bacterium]
DSQFEAVKLNAPADAPLNMLLPDPLDCTIGAGPMLRLIDIAEVFTALRYPADCRGRLSIAVRDSWLDWNQATYELEVSDGVIACRRQPYDAAADLCCDVGVLTQLLTRYLRPRTAAAFGLLEVTQRPALDLIERLFAGLAPFSSDYY